MSVKKITQWEITGGETFANEEEAKRADLSFRLEKLVINNTHQNELRFDDFFNSLLQNLELTKDFVEFSQARVSGGPY